MTSTPGGVHRRTAGGLAPLSYAQERMWFLNQLEPASTVYSGVRATRWKGRLDQEALERAVGELRRRHEVLRTRFPLGAEGPSQEIEPDGPFLVPLVDLSTGGPAAAMAETHAWLAAETRRPFELTREAPFRASLLRVAQDDHVLALTIHHIAFDRWSRSILRRELGLLYAAFAAGRPSPLPEPPVQYQDYADWQRERMFSEEGVRALAYWRGRLRGAPAVLALPSDHPRQVPPTYLGRQAGFIVPQGMVEAFDRLGRRERVTLFMTLLAAFKALLARVTGQTDLVVGVPVAGRTRLELSGLIGCFTNTLVLRTDASGNPTFRELLHRVRHAALEGYAHQELPFERLVRELQPERRPGQHPLFQVLFNYLDFPPEPLNTPGIEVDEFEIPSDAALVDLGVDIRRTGQGLTCTITGDAGMFEAPTIGRLAREYRASLESFASDPECRISALPDTWRGADPDQTDLLVRELEQMTDDEAERLLAAEARSGNDE
jgi:hypothetical protein